MTNASGFTAYCAVLRLSASITSREARRQARNACSCLLDPLPSVTAGWELAPLAPGAEAAQRRAFLRCSIDRTHINYRRCITICKVSVLGRLGIAITTKTPHLETGRLAAAFDRERGLLGAQSSTFAALCGTGQLGTGAVHTPCYCKVESGQQVGGRWYPTGRACVRGRGLGHRPGSRSRTGENRAGEGCTPRCLRLNRWQQILSAHDVSIIKLGCAHAGAECIYQ